METIRIVSDIFKETNIYMLLNSLINIEEGEVKIYTFDPKIKEELACEHAAAIQKYFKNKKVNYIFDPSLFPELTENKPIPKKGYLRGSEIARELAVEPFFVSSGINDAAYGFAEKFINSNRSTIYFLYGLSATGKSHLAAKIAVSLFEKGERVYFANGDSFISEIFNCYKNNVDFLSVHEDTDCFIIDDIQTLNKQHLMSVLDYLFTVITHIANTRGKIIVTSDQHPSALKSFPVRIITRLLSDYIAEMKKPDDNIKRQYIEHNFRKMQLIFTTTSDEEDIKNYILLNSPHLRVARGLLGICDIVSSLFPSVSFSEFIIRVPRQTPLDSMPISWRIRDVLLNYFWEEDSVEKKKQKGKGERRNRRKTLKTDSVCYYLLQDSLPLKVLQKDLKIRQTHHKYYLAKGKQIYEEIQDESLKLQLKFMMQK